MKTWEDWYERYGPAHFIVTIQPDNIPDIPNRPWDDEEPDEDKR